MQTLCLRSVAEQTQLAMGNTNIQAGCQVTDFSGRDTVLLRDSEGNSTG